MVKNSSVWYKSSFLLNVLTGLWNYSEGHNQFPEICLSLSANHHHDDLHEWIRLYTRQATQQQWHMQITKTFFLNLSIVSLFFLVALLASLLLNYNSEAKKFPKNVKIKHCTIFPKPFRNFFHKRHFVKKREWLFWELFFSSELQLQTMVIQLLHLPCLS